MRLNQVRVDLAAMPMEVMKNEEVLHSHQKSRIETSSLDTA